MLIMLNNQYLYNMGNYKIKVEVSTITDEVIAEFTVNSNDIDTAKIINGRNLIVEGLNIIFNDIDGERKLDKHQN